MKETQPPQPKIKQHMCSSRAEASELLARWKAMLPVVPPAYKPSGIVPVPAMQSMIAATAVAAPVSAVAGCIALCVGTLVAVLPVMLFNHIAKVFNRLMCCPVVITFLLVAATYLVMYASIGAVAGVIITKCGRRKKNRSTRAAALLSALAAAVGSTCFWLAVRTIGEVNRELVVLFALAFTHGGASIGFLVLGLIIAGATAAAVALAVVESSKFCETCDEYMSEWRSCPLSFETARAVADRVKAGKIGDIPSLLAPAEEYEALPNLHRCETCGNGFLETSVAFSAVWPNGKSTQTTKSEWLAVSVALNAEEVGLLKGVFHDRKTCL
jgi:hypothetical protein